MVRFENGRLPWRSCRKHAVSVGHATPSDVQTACTGGFMSLSLVQGPSHWGCRGIIPCRDNFGAGSPHLSNGSAALSRTGRSGGAGNGGAFAGGAAKLELAEHRAPIDLKEFRHPTHRTMHLNRPQQKIALHLCHDFPKRPPGRNDFFRSDPHLTHAPGDLRGQIAGGNQRPLERDDQTVHQILQLAHIARPGVARERLQSDIHEGHALPMAVYWRRKY